MKSLSDAVTMQEYTGCKGIRAVLNINYNYLIIIILYILGMMSARSILHNPGLFAGHQITPLSAVQNWLNIHHTNFLWFHHHLVFMCEHLLPKKERNIFNKLRKASDVVSFLEDRFNLTNILPSNRTLGKEPSGTSGAYYQNVTVEENSSNQPEDVMDSLFRLFD